MRRSQSEEARLQRDTMQVGELNEMEELPMRHWFSRKFPEKEDSPSRREISVYKVERIREMVQPKRVGPICYL